ncbi:MAG: FMN-binding protein [marine benthic group bacterium]|nr:FMN-binding protein [Gemmatimonadota bacterium]
MKELPQVSPDVIEAADAGAAREAGGGGPTAPPERPATSSARLVATLAAAGALAGLVIVLVFGWANPKIQAHRAEVLRQAIQEVLNGPESVRTYYVVDGALSESPVPGADTITAERIHLGLDDAGEPVGYAITGQEPGFQDMILVIFGYDAETERVLAMKVLESKETPGLGDKIFKDTSFVAEFRGAAAPLEGVKSGAGSGVENEVDMITGATISSRTVIEIINNRIEALGPMLDESGS